MRKLFTPIFLIISQLSFGQISIINSDMPRQNDTMRFSLATSGITALQAAKTGADTTWDFSNLVANSQDVEKFYAPSATPYVIQFGLLNSATYGLKDNALNNIASLGGAAGFTIENIYGFYKNTASANVLIGRGATVSNIPLGLNLNPRDTVFKFPLNYGDIDTTYYAGSTSIAGLGGIAQQGRRVNIVDGWGLIKTPYGQFDCIRIKTFINGVDSIQLSTFKIPIPNNKTIYTWYAKGQHYPIMEITQTIGVGAGLTIKYKDIYRAEVFINASKFIASKTNASQFDTINLTSQSAGTPKSYEWTITPSTFRFVGGTNNTTRNPRVMFDQSGSYSIKLKVIYEGGQDDTLRTNYINVVTTGLNNFENNKPEISIYPNPTTDVLNIESNMSLAKSKILVTDLLGKEIENMNYNLSTLNLLQINTSNFSKGIYLVNIVNENNISSTHKIVIN
jgi:PKD repeat protein